MVFESRNREPATPGARPRVGKIGEGTWRFIDDHMPEIIGPKTHRT